MTSASVSEKRRATLTVALAFAQLPPQASELQLLHRRIDTWPGLGAVVMGMRRHGWDLQLTGYGDGRWATFWRTNTNPPVLGGSAREGTAWAPVQQAAWETLDKRARW